MVQYDAQCTVLVLRITVSFGSGLVENKVSLECCRLDVFSDGNKLHHTPRKLAPTQHYSGELCLSSRKRSVDFVHDYRRFQTVPFAVVLVQCVLLLHSWLLMSLCV